MKSLLYLIALILVISWAVYTYQLKLSGLLISLAIIGSLIVIVQFILKKYAAK